MKYLSWGVLIFVTIIPFVICFHLLPSIITLSALLQDASQFNLCWWLNVLEHFFCYLTALESKTFINSNKRWNDVIKIRVAKDNYIINKVWTIEHWYRTIFDHPRCCLRILIISFFWTENDWKSIYGNLVEIFCIFVRLLWKESSLSKRV